MINDHTLTHLPSAGVDASTSHPSAAIGRTSSIMPSACAQRFSSPTHFSSVPHPPVMVDNFLFQGMGECTSGLSTLVYPSASASHPMTDASPRFVRNVLTGQCSVPGWSPLVLPFPYVVAQPLEVIPLPLAIWAICSLAVWKPPTLGLLPTPNDQPVTRWI